MKNRALADGVIIVLLACAAPCVVFATSIFQAGGRNMSKVESIHGIAFPEYEGSRLIVEEMAHADLFLQESVFAKQAKISISFDPQQLESLDLGVRENEFWLSYIRYPLYQKGIDPLGLQTKEITIPLTSAMQDIDRSIDLMFFSSDSETTQWRIHAFRATVEPIMPSKQEVKNYIKSVFTRERPL